MVNLYFKIYFINNYLVILVKGLRDTILKKMNQKTHESKINIIYIVTFKVL